MQTSSILPCSFLLSQDVVVVLFATLDKQRHDRNRVQFGSRGCVGDVYPPGITNCNVVLNCSEEILIMKNSANSGKQGSSGWSVPKEYRRVALMKESNVCSDQASIGFDTTRGCLVSLVFSINALIARILTGTSFTFFLRMR